MKWSPPLVVLSMGTRVGTAGQVTPSTEVLITMSFDEQAARKRQSAQATYTWPLASPSAEGSTGARIPVGSWDCSEETTTAGLKLAPPSVERIASTLLPATPVVTRVPSGCTTGRTPTP